MPIVDQAFESLFFGSGSWLGLLLFICMFLGLQFKWKHTGALTIPIAVFIGIEYLDNDLGWQALIMFFTALFIMLMMVKDLKRG